MSKCLAKLQKCRLCTVHLLLYSKGPNYLWRCNLFRKKIHTKVHSFLKQYFERSRVEIILEHSQMRSAEVSWDWLENQLRVPSNYVKWRSDKHCFKNEWTLQCFYVRKLQENIEKTLLDKNKNAPSEIISSNCVQHSFRTF